MKHLFTILLLLCGFVNSHAYITVDGIYYNITSESDKTVEVTTKDNTFGQSYSGIVSIPNSIEYNGNKYSVTAIGKNAFYWCSSLSRVDIPASVLTINSSAFNLCTSLRTIYNYASSPQSITSSTFTYASWITVHVYKGSKAAYASATGWSACTIVDDIDPIKITEISLGQSNITCEPYEGYKLSYTLLPNDASIKDLEWSSEDENIAHVMSDGTVIGVAEGDVVISVKSKDGGNVSVECNVHVNICVNNGSYNNRLSSQMTGYSMSQIGGSVRKSISFNLQNGGKNYIKVTKLIVKNPNNNYSTLSSTTDQSLLGWIGNGSAIELSVTLTSDITPCYEWHYLYKGIEYVYCSSTSDPAYVSYENEPEPSGIGSVNIEQTNTENIFHKYIKNGKVVISNGKNNYKLNGQVLHE